ncbi:DUF6086 family protein [Kitasatospora sp. NPDC059827]|uniref:DUF6086 family protein n=1 Tax=Kitasatospora sp. NPDC059827 TaxID=3346964 RepID=UPI00365C7574
MVGGELRRPPRQLQPKRRPRGDEGPLWNPSTGASRLFLRQVEIFEEELGLPSGIGPMEADECQIEPAVLGVFANAILARHRRTRHAVVRALTEGFVLTTLALAERAGAEIHWEEPPGPTSAADLRDVQIPMTVAGSGSEEQWTWGEELRRKVHELDRAMAR